MPLQPQRTVAMAATLQGPSTTVAPDGAPIYIRLLAMPSQGDTTRYHIAPNMLVYTLEENNTEKAADNTDVMMAFTDRRAYPAGKSLVCIGVSVTAIRTDSDDTAHRMFTACVQGPTVLAGDFTDFYMAQRLYPTRLADTVPSPKFALPPHKDHQQYGILEASANIPPTTASVVLLDTTGYNDGALAYFSP